MVGQIDEAEYARAAIAYVEALAWVKERQDALDAANTALGLARAHLTETASTAGLSDFS